MNSDILKGKWESIKGRVKEVYGDLTDSDTHKVSGAFQEAMGHLQEKYGETKEAIEDKLMKLVSDTKEDKNSASASERRPVDPSDPNRR